MLARAIRQRAETEEFSRIQRRCDGTAALRPSPEGGRTLSIWRALRNNHFGFTPRQGRSAHVNAWPSVYSGIQLSVLLSSEPSN